MYQNGYSNCNVFHRINTAGLALHLDTSVTQLLKMILFSLLNSSIHWYNYTNASLVPRPSPQLQGEPGNEATQMIKKFWCDVFGFLMIPPCCWTLWPCSYKVSNFDLADSEFMNIVDSATCTRMGTQTAMYFIGLILLVLLYI